MKELVEVIATSDDAALDPERAFEVQMPLRDEVERWRDDERGAVLGGHCKLRDKAFARARREDDNSRCAVVFPGLERL